MLWCHVKNTRNFIIEQNLASQISLLQGKLKPKCGARFLICCAMNTFFLFVLVMPFRGYVNISDTSKVDTFFFEIIIRTTRTTYYIYRKAREIQQKVKSTHTNQNKKNNEEE